MLRLEEFEGCGEKSRFVKSGWRESCGPSGGGNSYRCMVDRRFGIMEP